MKRGRLRGLCHKYRRCRRVKEIVKVVIIVVVYAVEKARDDC